MTPDGPAAEPAPPAWWARLRARVPARWAWRGVAVLLIVCQVGIVASVVPLQDRWFLHSDDHGKYVLATAVMERGAPSAPLQGRQYTNTTAFAPFGMAVKGNLTASYSGPGYSYLLAPATELGPTAAFAFQQTLLVLALLAVYFLVERPFGGLAGVAGLALFAFSAPAVYWGPLLYASIPGLGLLALALLLLDRGSRRDEVLAIAVAVLAASFRYEFLLFVAAVGVAWLVRTLRQGKRWRYFVPHTLAAAAGAALFFAVSYALTGKLNFVAANANPAAAAGGSADVERTVELTLGHIQVANLHYYNDLLFVSVFLLPALLVAATFFLPRGRPWFFPPLFATLALLTVFVLGNLFFPQKRVLDHSPNRYLLPLLLCAALAVGFLLARAGTAVQKGLLCAVVALFCVGGTLLGTGPEGLAGNGPYLEIAKGTVAEAKGIPADAVFVGEHLDKMLVGRLVLNPLNLPEAQQRPETVAILQKVLADGHPAYISRIYDDQYRPWILGGRMQLVQTPGRWLLEIKPRA
jgi:hypothetical protein